MSVKPQFTIREAVARCFPTSIGYDRQVANRLIKWLEHCGYEIRPIEQASLVPEPGEHDLEPDALVNDQGNKACD
jgi:hypothetical protein